MKTQTCPQGGCGKAPNTSYNDCSSQGCDTQCSTECNSSCSSEDMIHKSMMSAMMAKKSLFNDKLKAHFDKKIGEKMDSMADYVTDLVIEKWEHKKTMQIRKSEVSEEFANMMK